MGRLWARRIAQEGRSPAAPHQAEREQFLGRAAIRVTSAAGGVRAGWWEAEPGRAETHRPSGSKPER